MIQLPISMIPPMRPGQSLLPDNPQSMRIVPPTKRVVAIENIDTLL